MTVRVAKQYGTNIRMSEEEEDVSVLYSNAICFTFSTIRDTGDLSSHNCKSCETVWNMHALGWVALFSQVPYLTVKSYISDLFTIL